MESGDTDRRLTVLTRSLGKIDLVAKGARKAGSRLAGSSEPLVRSVFHFASGRNRRFVTQVQPTTSYPGIRTDYLSLSAALALAELATRALPYESPAEDWFDMLASGLALLDAGAGPAIVFAWETVRLLRVDGHEPNWTTCSVTGCALDSNPAAFSPMAGGYVESGSASQFQDRINVSAEALIALKKLVHLPVPPERLGPAQDCVRALLHLWSSATDSSLPAGHAFLDAIRRTGESDGLAIQSGSA